MPRYRACDTCRLRKTRCVRENGWHRYILCNFHGYDCSFPTGGSSGGRDTLSSAESRRRYLARQDVHDYREGVDGRALEPNSSTSGSLLLPDQGSGVSLGRCDGNSAQASVVHSQRQLSSSPEPSPACEILTVCISTPPAAAYPSILTDTLDLDPATHAELVGPTDHREPVLLDLSRLNKPPSGPHFPQRVDDRTIFLVHSDEARTFEFERIANLDAIEAAVGSWGPTLVDLYFRIVHPSFPILHKEVFITKHRSSYRHFAPSLLAAVYLVALDWHLYDTSLAGGDDATKPNPTVLNNLAR